MRNKKKFLSILLFTVLTFILMPVTASAAVSDNNITTIDANTADVDGDGYDDTDVAIIQNIINNSATLSARYGTTPDPAAWYSDGFIIWNGNKKVFSIIFESLNINDYSGTLDVSGLTELNSLICHRNENLNAIILPQGNAFTYLNCDDTGITQLDVSGNPSLQVLYCARTDITALDVSKNTVLEILCCSDTQITALDISENTALSELECSNTNISVLDTSANSVLKSLICRGTKITTLDLSNNPALTILGTDVNEFVFANGGTLTIDNKTPNAIGVGEIYMGSFDIATRRVTLTASVMLNGYMLDKWIGLPADAQVNGNTASFIVDGDITVSATYSRISPNPAPTAAPNPAPTVAPAHNIPNTGDTGNIMLWLVLMMGSVVGLTVVIKLKAAK